MAKNSAPLTCFNNANPRPQGQGRQQLSDRQDLNLRPLHPQCSALPNCATARSNSKTTTQVIRTANWGYYCGSTGESVTIIPSESA